MIFRGVTEPFFWIVPAYTGVATRAFREAPLRATRTP